MNTQKIAITVPSDLLDIIDEITTRRSISRSKFISLLLREKLQEERNRHLKNEYDKVFSDKSICDEQLKTAMWFDGAGSKEGQEW
ncbi:MAG TPA: ribbon-helix-helix protein, CopG family [Desulfobacterales bacterium]|nr:ribbon-helix-helix protein, CopG family [Desulfobacterales bacterium]